jgi:hypothetical protein
MKPCLRDRSWWAASEQADACLKCGHLVRQHYRDGCQDCLGAGPYASDAWWVSLRNTGSVKS